MVGLFSLYGESKRLAIYEVFIEVSEYL